MSIHTAVDWIMHIMNWGVVWCWMVSKFMAVVWIFSKRMNIGSVLTIFHGVFLSLSLPLHLSSFLLFLLLFHTSFFFLFTSQFLAHLLVLLLLSKVFVSMIHSVVLMHWSMVSSHLMMSQWGSIMMELVGIVSHSTKEAVVLLTVVLFLLELLEKSVGCKVLIGLSGIDNAG